MLILTILLLTLLFLILILLLIMFICWFRCSAVKDSGSVPEKLFLQSTVYKPTTEIIEEKTVLLDEDSPTICQQPIRNGEASGVNPSNRTPPPPIPIKLSRTPTHPVAVEDLAGYVRDAIQNGDLRKELELLPRGQLRQCTRAMENDVRDKNRYGKILPYDETRVVLDIIDDDSRTDYINANYVDGYCHPKAYIATQGPKENTIVDFWRMVWQENVTQIIMLTNLVELGKKKCEKYWPESVQTYGPITVCQESAEVLTDFTIRRFNIKKVDESCPHVVTQYHYTSWLDHGVPMYPSVLVSFLKMINAENSEPNSGPIVIHCSAGINRTGTYILMDSVIHMGQAEGTVDVLGHLFLMRQQRVNLLDNAEQYELVHTTAVEALLIEKSVIPCSQYQAFYDKLNTSTETKHMNNLYQQYEVLESFRPHLTEDNTRSGLEQCNLTKNRDMNILPDEKQRVHLKQSGAFPSSYINAVYVSSYKQKDTFIATQFPVQETVVDFWRMVLDHHCHLVVVLNDLDFTDNGTVPFYPNYGETMSLPNVVLKSESVMDENGVTVQQINFTPVHGNQPERQIYFVHYNGWQIGEYLPPSADRLVQLLETSLQIRQTLPGGPVLLTCYDGSNACGLFCASAFICMKIKAEQEVDVFTAVRAIRMNRPSFINNVQYNYCYEVAKAFLNMFQTYATFN